MGLNNVGQCGVDNDDEDYESVIIPHLITTLENEQIESIVCGKGNAMAMNSRGIVYKWGAESPDDFHSDREPRRQKNFKNKEVLRISAGREFLGILIAATDPLKSFATGKALNSTLKAGK
jgi:hypothetical protein